MAHYKQAAFILFAVVAALMAFDRCHAAVISNADAADQDASANHADSSAAAAAAAPAASDAKGGKKDSQPTCPPLDLLLINPIDVGFSRDCILTYLARAFSKDMAPVNKKAITYAVDHLERALTQLQLLNGQMRACDDTVRTMAARDVQANGGAPMPMPPNGMMMPPPMPNGLPPPDSNGNVPPPPPRQSNLPQQQEQSSSSVVGQAVILPPGSAVVVPTAAVSAAAAKQAVASNNKNA